MTSPEQPDVRTQNRRALSEDWLATLAGIVLLVLVLAGVLTGVPELS